MSQQLKTLVMHLLHMQEYHFIAETKELAAISKALCASRCMVASFSGVSAISPTPVSPGPISPSYYRCSLYGSREVDLARIRLEYVRGTSAHTAIFYFSLFLFCTIPLYSVTNCITQLFQLFHIVLVTFCMSR